MVEVNLNCESDIKPNKSVIENITDNKCDIILNDNIIENTKINENGQEEIYYTYDMYRIVANSYRDTLKDDLENENDFTLWLNFAKEQYSKQVVNVSNSERISALEQAIIDLGEVVGNG